MKNDGFTIMEILISISVALLIMSAGGGIFLSSAIIGGDTADYAQAHRNAMAALLHIEKNVCNAAGAFTITGEGSTLEYKIYTASVYTTPSVTSQYVCNGSDLTYYPDKRETSVDSVFGHISNCVFSLDADGCGCVLNVQITALDNEDNPASAYTVDTHVQGRLTADPAVF